MNKATTTYYTVPLDELQSEIARLKAELEKAQASKDHLWISYRTLVTRNSIALEERDESRKWARKMYRRALFAEAWKEMIENE